jgi:hypothetical protein
MKLNILFLSIFIAVVCGLFQSCDDALEQYPNDRPSPETFFTTENELKLYTNSLLTISQITGYLNDAPSDNIIHTSLPDEVAGIRNAASTGGWSFTNLRKVNYFLDNSHKCPDEAVRNRYNGIARFFRAYFYFGMVQRYGDVPWYSHVLSETDQEQLYKSRDSRLVVTDSILQDINFAIAYCPDSKKTYEVTKWTALALKSRFCLFEGTFRKYHGINGWEKFIDECISASEALVAGGQYRIYTGGGTDVAYRDLFTLTNANPDEIIFASGFDANNQIKHSANYYTLVMSYGAPGLEKQLVNSYLKADGSRFTDIPDYDKMYFTDEMQNRDPRLFQTIRGLGYKRIDGDQVLSAQFGYSVTGYQPVKFVCNSKYDTPSANDNDLPVYRYAEILLNLAEAKAEKGNLTQSDIDRTVKLLRDRVGMPNLNMDAANASPDPFMENQYPAVSGANKGVILEIRRERRIELVMENVRYWDVMRWKAGKQFERQFKGIYFPGPGFYDLDGDGENDDLAVWEKGQKPSDDIVKAYPQQLEIGTNIQLEHGSYGNIVINPNIAKHWTETKDYFYPIPITEIVLNPNLGQNPEWEK